MFRINDLNWNIKNEPGKLINKTEYRQNTVEINLHKLYFMYKQSIGSTR